MIKTHFPHEWTEALKFQDFIFMYLYGSADIAHTCYCIQPIAKKSVVTPFINYIFQSL